MYSTIAIWLCSCMCQFLLRLTSDCWMLMLQKLCHCLHINYFGLFRGIVATNNRTLSSHTVIYILTATPLYKANDAQLENIKETKRIKTTVTMTNYRMFQTCLFCLWTDKIKAINNYSVQLTQNLTTNVNNNSKDGDFLDMSRDHGAIIRMETEWSNFTEAG